MRRDKGIKAVLPRTRTALPLLFLRALSAVHGKAVAFLPPLAPLPAPRPQAQRQGQRANERRRYTDAAHARRSTRSTSTNGHTTLRFLILYFILLRFKPRSRPPLHASASAMRARGGSPSTGAVVGYIVAKRHTIGVEIKNLPK